MVSLKGTVILLLLFLSSLFGSVFMLGPLLPIMLVSVPWYRWITDRVVAVWFTFPVALLEMVLGVRVVITGDGFVPGESSVIIMNHRTRLDWMYLWNCLLRYSYLRMEKICLKSSLKTIPGFGWAMQVAAFIFIERQWERDQDHLKAMLDYFSDGRQPLQLLMFPEGTDLTTSTRVKSDEFAESRALPKYEYVLHPRTTGFAFIVDLLRKGSNLDAIHDVTVAYPYNIPQSEKDLFSGNFPKEIHFHIRRYSAANLPVTLEGLQAWCQLRWQDKEQLLHRFYQGDRSFRGLDQEQSPQQPPEQIPEQSTNQDQSPDQEQNQGLDQERDRSQGLGPVAVSDRNWDRGQSHRRRWAPSWGRFRRRERMRLMSESQDQAWQVVDRGRGRGHRQPPRRLVPPCKSRGRVFLIKLFSMLYWTGFIVGSFMLLWSYTLARWYFSTMAVFFILQERLLGGIEVMEVALHKRRSKKH
ncbi:lysocardiolipin acyltransferase 1 [Rhinoraja longicauda]